MEFEPKHCLRVLVVVVDDDDDDDENDDVGDDGGGNHHRYKITKYKIKVHTNIVNYGQLNKSRWSNLITIFPLARIPPFLLNSPLFSTAV